MTATIDALGAAGVLSALDLHFARSVARIGAEERPRVLLAMALASRQVSRGHVCLDLPRLAAESIPLDETGEPLAGVRWPQAQAWLEELRASAVAVRSGEAAALRRPLVVDERGRVYLYRYWDHQRRLAAALKARAATVESGIDRRLLVEGLERLFAPAAPSSRADGQRLAAAVAVLRRLCVISGGPGTGKTHTVVKILALLLEQARAACGTPRLGIHLLAPTGKAAARLGESIEKAKATLACDGEVRAAIPTEAATIHRCLGSLRGSDTRFRFHASRPLLADVVLVDEASMVDLALMARLGDALPAEARLILLGDKDQLASVEAGAVLGDICNTGAPLGYSRAFLGTLAEIAGKDAAAVPAARDETTIHDSIVPLERSYRYGPDSGIGRLARAINAGDAAAALALLESGAADLLLIAPGRDGSLPGPLRAQALEGFRDVVRGRGPEQCLAALERLRFLCAHRRGPLGVDGVNAQVEEVLAGHGLRGAARRARSRPILVTQNDYQIGLFNGDVGLILEQGEDGERSTAAYFATGGGLLRRLAPSRLPPHETAFAMTVHRSQGSEFDEVVVVLPEKESPVVTRELLYTAVTRARRRVTVCARREIVERAVRTPIERASGLRDELYG